MKPQEDDFDEDGYRWECQGCADKFNMSASEYRENSNCDVKFCEYAAKCKKEIVVFTQEELDSFEAYRKQHEIQK